MARSVNRVILMGNLTRDVEIRFTPQNMAVGNFGMALNREWKTPTGEVREEVTFVDCEVWGKGAEILQKYAGKGKRLFVEGRLKLDQWKDKTDGSNRTKLKIVVEDFSFVDGGKGGGGEGPGAGAGAGGGEDYSGGGGGGYGGGGGGYGGGGGNGGGGGGMPAPQVRPRGAAPAPVAPVTEDDIPF